MRKYTAEEMEAYRQAIRATMDDRDKAQAAYKKAQDLFDEAILAAVRAEAWNAFFDLSPEQQAILRGPCPQGPDAVPWMKDGWIMLVESREMRGVLPVSTYRWCWSEKANTIRAKLGVPLG